MAVHLHRGLHPDALVAGLARMLLQTPRDAFAPEVVSVPTRGVERYISHGLAHHLGTTPGGSDGVCANVAFPAPADVVADAMEAVAGVARGSDPWRPERLAWPLLASIDDGLDQAWCKPLSRHLGGDRADAEGSQRRRDRRFALASRLAKLFASYSRQRPEMLLAWSEGSDTDGAGSAVPADLAWQPELWRSVRSRVGMPSPAERLEPACAEIIANPGLLDLPDRLSVFGPTRVATDQLRLLRALAEHREVHLWLCDPSPGLWPRVAAGSGRTDGNRTGRVAAAALPVVGNSLLRSLAREAGELRMRLVQELPGIEAPLDADARIEPVRSRRRARGDETLLVRLQDSLRTDTRLPVGESLGVLAESDSSVQVHACHGSTRQAEVLREAVLGLLAADETLQPRDILVMCPDLMTMAPLISAAFTGADERLAALRVRIADRTPEQGNDVLATLAQLLAVTPGRMLLSEILDLLARTPIRTRFGLDEDDLERLEQLALRAGIRWGLDEVTRQSYHLRGVPASTWSWGLDRLLLGVALSEDGLPLIGDALPLDDVTTSDLQRIGRLAELITRLARFRDGALTRQPLNAWVSLLDEAVTGLMAARGSDSWQVSNALAVIAALPQNAGDCAADVELGLPDIRWMLDSALAGRPTRSNFGSGGLTVCGLEPMRTVPHRVVCLVGLDDGVFPRAGRRDGDDVLARDRWCGERDERSEDRQALLDSILAAGDHLVITYTGADDRTNEGRPPCVPLGELLDALDGLARTVGGGPARQQVVIQHPLQPFDERCFLVGTLTPGASFSHDPEALAGAVAARLPRRIRPAVGLVVPELPVERTQSMTLAQLVSFLRAPALTFLRERVGLSVRADEDALPESLPLEVVGLARWALGDRAVHQLALGRSDREVAAAERGRGCLPPAEALARPVLDSIGPQAQEVSQQLVAARQGPARLVPVHLTLPSGRTLSGSVPDVHDGGIVRGSFSRPRLTKVVPVWPEVLALGAGGLGSRAAATLIGNGDPLRVASPPAEQAAALLDELLEIYDSGMASPLPLPLATSGSYAQLRQRLRIPASVAAARREWRRPFEGHDIGESTNRESALLYGPGADLEAVMEEAPRDGESWYPEETSRFGTLARRLWEPILSSMQVQS